jgi:plasmid stabilization system protein ParE
MATVRFAPRADSDIEAILVYLHAEAGQRAAERYRDEFRALRVQLTAHPDSGSPRPQFGRGVRITVVHPYVIAYRHDAMLDEVVILRVMHGARRMSAQALRGRRD